MAFRRRTRGRRSFRGSSAKWRSNTWGFTPIGDLNQNDVFACREQVGPYGSGIQAFYPILVDDMFSGNVNFNPFNQERVTCIRHMGSVDILFDLPDGGQNPLVRWCIARLDEEAVQDVTYAFPSLFGIDFLLQERILQVGDAPYTGNFYQVSTEQPTGVPRERARIEWDLKNPIRLETGETLWFVIEAQPCEDNRPLPVPDTASMFIQGWTRALWRT